MRAYVISKSCINSMLIERIDIISESETENVLQCLQDRGAGRLFDFKHEVLSKEPTGIDTYEINGKCTRLEDIVITTDDRFRTYKIGECRI